SALPDRLGRQHGLGGRAVGGVVAVQPDDTVGGPVVGGQRVPERRGGAVDAQVAFAAEGDGCVGAVDPSAGRCFDGRRRRAGYVVGARFTFHRFIMAGWSRGPASRPPAPSSPVRFDRWAAPLNLT